MEKIINPQNLRCFAYTNAHLCKNEIKGVVVFFLGLNETAMFSEDRDDGIFFAKEDILFVLPYIRPWAWMNKQSVEYTEEILDVIFDAYGLPEDTPITYSGRSMGGLEAIMFTKKAKRKPVACVANSPVCDLAVHYSEREDLPRTIYCAFWDEEGPFEEVIKAASPIYTVSEMPKTKYHVFHCDEDMAVNIDEHSRRFVAVMQKNSHDITFDVIKGRGHCDIGEEMWKKFWQCSVDAIKQFNS